MRSHTYLFSVRELLRTTAAPVLGLMVLTGALQLGNRLHLLPAARPSEKPDQTLLVFKSDLCRSKPAADVLLLGDSSCATGVDAPELSRLLPGQPTVVNLGLIIGLGLDVYAEALDGFTEGNPHSVKWVVLLATPQLLAHEDESPILREFWRQLRGSTASAATAPAQGWSWAGIGPALVRDRLLPRLLNTPLPGRGAAFYGFTSGFEGYLSAHAGSMADPREYVPVHQVSPPRYRFDLALVPQSQRFRAKVPPGARLAVGLMPVPESLAIPRYAERRDDLLATWNETLQADGVLTNLPALLPDGLFATRDHLNPRGQERFTRLLAAVLGGLERQHLP